MGGEESKVPKAQCVVAPPERKGESGIYRNSIELNFDPKRQTLFESFSCSAEQYPSEPCLGWRTNDGPYKFIDYKETFDYVKEIGSALLHYGLVPHQSKVGIYSINRHEWVVTEQACHAYSFCIVPLYDTLGKEAVSFIANESELEIIFCSGDKLSLLLSIVKELKGVQSIVVFDQPDEKLVQQALDSSIKLIAWPELRKIGKQYLSDVVPPEKEEMCTICYTSGTTGLPKGVKLTHSNIIADILAVKLIGIYIAPGDVHISYLPLAHMYEKNVSNAILYYGGAVGFYRGDVRLLFDDITELKPTVFCSVPRLYNRLYDKVMQNVKIGGITQMAFDHAFEAKVEGLKKGLYTHSVYDSLIFNKVKAKLGGRVKIMMTGSAPLSDKVLEFLRVVFGCPIIEGYGQTETSAGATMTTIDQTDCGHVGFPLPGVELKLVDVPAMNYFTSDVTPRGEVCFRGHMNTSGYFKNDEKTAELIDEHGWLHTGDIGMILPNKTLKIIDRVKNIFKISLGEYIAPEKLENIFVQSQYVLQSFVHGDSLKASVIAVVIPDPETVLPWARENKKSDKMEELCRDEDLIKLIMNDMTAVGKKNQLKGFEFPKKIFLSPEPFSMENDTLTPTFKLKRPQAKAKYDNDINKLYEDLD